MKKLVIVGAGPAALSAAIYAARECLDVTVYERESLGGLASGIDLVENYPGAFGDVTGLELAEKMRAQAEKFGAKIEYGEVSEISEAGAKKVLVVDGVETDADAVLIATGCSRVKLGVAGEEEFAGRGVHYCATCDGAFYKDKTVAVIGGGNSAVQEALFLTRFAKKVEIVALAEITASGVLKERLKEAVAAKKIKVNTGMETLEIVGDTGKVTGVRVKKGGKERVLKVEGVFIFVGLKPATEFLKGSGVKLSEKGFVETGADFMTSMSGVFAAGDVREGATRQIVCAAGEGAAAVLRIGEWLGGLK